MPVALELAAPTRAIPRSDRAPRRRAARSSLRRPSSGPDSRVSKKSVGRRVSPPWRGSPAARRACRRGSPGAGAAAARAHRSVPPRRRGAVVLGPAEQRRDEQAGEIEIVERLDREAGGGEQVLDRERRRQQQPVDPGHRHALGMEPRDEQGGEIAAPAHQDQDVLGAQRPAAAVEMEGSIEPGLDLLGKRGSRSGARCR